MSDYGNFLTNLLIEFVQELGYASAKIVESHYEEDDPLQTEHVVDMPDEAIAELIHDYVEDRSGRTCHNCANFRICKVYGTLYPIAESPVWSLAVDLYVSCQLQDMLLTAIAERCSLYRVRDEEDAC